MMVFNKFILVGLLLGLLNIGFISPVVASEAIAAKLSTEDSKDLKRIEAYLNGMKTLRAGFLQVSSNGGVATGKFMLARPGKMRFEYDPPAPILMVADGVFLIYIDKELEQVTHLWLNNTPIGFLVKEDIKLNGDVTVTKFSKGSNILHATLARSEEPEQGTITMIFSDNPLSLRKWTVTDAQGVKTTVTLSNLESAVTLDPELFKFNGLPNSE
jgi:outer membrane lipoprotein-sorting protein